jgi:hypothetical protein
MTASQSTNKEIFSLLRQGLKVRYLLTFNTTLATAELRGLFFSID